LVGEWREDRAKAGAGEVEASVWFENWGS